MDIQLNYIEKGKGEPLILLHGNDNSCRYFEKQIDDFAKDYHVYAIDTRGHGLSPRGTKPFTIRCFAEDLKNFMDQKEIDKAHILGFSDGGNVALVFALNYPKMVDKLILNAANLYPRGIKTWTQFRIWLEYLQAKKKAENGPEEKRKYEMLHLLVKDPMVKVRELKKLRMETMILVGTKDLIKDSHSCLIAKNMKNSRMVFVEGGHGIAWDNPREYNKVVKKFLKE